MVSTVHRRLDRVGSPWSEAGAGPARLSVRGRRLGRDPGSVRPSQHLDTAHVQVWTEDD